ncbi:MAG: hypothetical protein ACM3Y9_12330 [Ignavibacteria bacterium]
MKASRLAVGAIVLWVATIGVFAWFFVHGATAPGSDQRTAILLAPAERDFVLTEMRGLLSGVHGILDGIDGADRTRIATAARAIGMASATDVEPALMTKLPLPFKELGMSVHHDMDSLAQAAEAGKPYPELQRMLTATMSKCIACHATWQFAKH